MQLLLSDVNECRQFPCQNNGTCYNFDGGFNCTCTPGFTGALCEIGKDSVIEFLFYFKIVNRITVSEEIKLFLQISTNACRILVKTTRLASTPMVPITANVETIGTANTAKLVMKQVT